MDMEHKIYSASMLEMRDDQKLCRALDSSARNGWHLVGYLPGTGKFIFARENSELPQRAAEDVGKGCVGNVPIWNPPLAVTVKS